MKRYRLIVVERKGLLIACAALLLLSAALLASADMLLPAASFKDPRNGVVVIDPGHGGVDGGTNQDGLLEKEINLDIAKRLRDRLTERGYTVVMTREEDVSLEEEGTEKNRHARDLRARADIINGSGAQLFISIHVNCMPKRPSADGAVVFYGSRYEQSRELAAYIQRTLNLIETDGERRTVREPVRGRYYLFGASVPGVIVETAFLSNPRERELLTRETFREQLASAIADGAELYLLTRNTALVSIDE